MNTTATPEAIIEAAPEGATGVRYITNGWTSCLGCVAADDTDEAAEVAFLAEARFTGDADTCTCDQHEDCRRFDA